VAAPSLWRGCALFMEVLLFPLLVLKLAIVGVCISHGELRWWVCGDGAVRRVSSETRRVPFVQRGPHSCNAASCDGAAARASRADPSHRRHHYTAAQHITVSVRGRADTLPDGMLALGYRS
jgi:hypothetical protein